MEKMKQPTPKSIDEYIAGCPERVQQILEMVRMTIRAAAPDAEETIKYQMPTFTLHGNLVYFAAWKEHIGFYPPIAGDEELIQAVAGYQGPKGNLQFPLDQPIPYALITKIVQQRIKEDLVHAAKKGKASESRK
jgi:uncharacterized protein YdhG (YjbR/CyaY superfamily)